jgi:uncharacterized membrane protein HdeD (DUF308 family)
MDDRIRHAEVRFWSLILGRGLIGALAGLLLLSNPWASVTRVAEIFAVYLGISFILNLVASTYAIRVGRRKGELAFIGCVDALATVATIVFPAALPLRLIGGIRGVISGLGDLFWTGHPELSELLSLSGVATAACGLLLLAWPGPAVSGLPWLLALQTIVSGALLVAGSLSNFRRLTTHAA